jgi:hypothetical protein
MSETARVPDVAIPRARFSHPSTLILLGANLLPLAGVLFWGWDAFVLLALYWLETAIIGFWMLVRIATAAPESLSAFKSGEAQTIPSRAGLTLFFIVHAGMFMGVHFVFLWTLFSGDWAEKIHSPVDFVAKLVIATGLWLPLVVLFFARGAPFLYRTIGGRVLAWANGRGMTAAPAEPAGSIVGAFYARVVTMHVAIIFGGFLSFLGSLGPLVIMIALKTAIDLGLHVAFDFGDGGKAFKALLQAREATLRQPPAS